MKENTPKIFSVASGKGGVGKTFITANLAASFARQGERTLVVDCDLGLANMEILLGIRPELTLKDVAFGEKEIADIIFSTEAGFDLIPASSGVKEMAQLLYEKIQDVKAMLETAFHGYDVVLLDTGAGISEVVIQFNLMAPRHIIVLNKEPTSMTDAYAMIKVMSQKYGRDTFSIIVSSAESGAEAQKIFSHMDSISTRFLDISLHYLGHVAYDRAVPQSIMKQEILVLSSPDSAASKNCASIAASLLKVPNLYA